MKNIYNIRKVYQNFSSANLFSVTVEHNGVHAGDAGHGGYVKLLFKDEGNTCMEVNGEKSEQVEIILKGSTERDNLIQALFAILRELYGPIPDENGPIPHFDSE
mgnify:FL=1